MFEEFFHLRENPFALAPNPRFIFQSHEHVEALAHFRYWIENGEGFVLITGEVGTGKTTALFDLMAQLPQEWSVGFVANSSLAHHELLEEVCRRFRLDVPPGSTRPTLLARLENYLGERGDHGMRSLLILDEAQNFETRLLEEVRLLSNLERATGKLLQIALVGQPELDRKLELPELRQLRQRIGIRYRLGPLTEEECVQYLHHRVAVAGGDAEHIFPVETGLVVYQLTHGIPREINVVASQALITAFVQGAESVRPEHVRAVVEEFNWSSIFGREVPPPRARRPRMSDAPALGTIGQRPTIPQRPSASPVRPEPALPPAAAPTPVEPQAPAAYSAAPAPMAPPPAASPQPTAIPFSPPVATPPPAAFQTRPLPPRAAPPFAPAAAKPSTPRPDPLRPRPALEVVRGRGAERSPFELPGLADSEQALPEAATPRAEAPPIARPEPPAHPESVTPASRPRPPAEPPRRPVLLAEPERSSRTWLRLLALGLVLALLVGGSFWWKAQQTAHQRPAKPASITGGAEPAPPAGERAEKSAEPNPPSGVDAGTKAPAEPPSQVPTSPAGDAESKSSTTSARPSTPPKTAARAESPASETPAPAVEVEPEYAILAASFVGNAERVAEVRREYELRFGLPVAVVRVDWGGSQWRNRVYVGSYTDRSAAERARRTLVAQGLESDSQVRSMANVVESP
jgi:type II secretory pathway predicted ATPase ExeA